MRDRILKSGVHVRSCGFDLAFSDKKVKLPPIHKQ